MLFLDELLLIFLLLHNLFVLQAEVLIILTKKALDVFRVVEWVLVARELNLSGALILRLLELKPRDILVFGGHLVGLRILLILILVASLEMAVLRSWLLLLHKKLAVVFFLGGAYDGKVSPRLHPLRVGLVAIVLLQLNLLVLLLRFYLVRI